MAATSSTSLPKLSVAESTPIGIPGGESILSKMQMSSTAKGAQQAFLAFLTADGSSCDIHKLRQASRAHAVHTNLITKRELIEFQRASHAIALKNEAIALKKELEKKGRATWTALENYRNLAGILLESNKIWHLDLSNSNINNVQLAAIIPGFTALRHLNLARTPVADVRPLAALTALRHLDLNRTQVVDVGPLATLTALQHLNLAYTQVANVQPLEALTELPYLDLACTPVADVRPLADLIALLYLDLNGTQVADVQPLEVLIALGHLNLRSTRVTDVQPLAALIALQHLDLAFTQVRKRPAPGRSYSAATPRSRWHPNTGQRSEFASFAYRL